MSQLADLLRGAVQANPGGVVTVFRGRERSWKEVHDRVQRLAGALLALRVGEGECVGVLAMNSDRFLELHFAVPWAGGVLAPLNIRWAEPENAFALADSKCRLLFVDEVFVDQASTLRARVPAITTLVYIGDGATPEGMLSYETLLAGHEPVPDAGRGDDDPYVIFYTSGTTAQSKGVLLSHRNAVFTALAFKATIPLDMRAVHLHVLGMFHVGSAQPLWYITMVGGTHVIHEKFDPELAMAAIGERAVTNTVLVPTMINMLLHHPSFARHDLSSVRTCVYGGSPMPLAILDRARAQLPTWGFHQIYGQTESSGYGTAFPWEEHVAAVGEKKSRLGSAGRAVPGVQVRIVDENRNELPPGELGEISLSGDNVMLGYFRNDGATQGAMDGRFILTGDVGYVDADGFLFIADRVKDMIITGGENVFSVDVERALYAHPAVLECAVIGIPHEHWVEAVHAVVVLKAAAEASADELIAHCRARIAGYKCPRTVALVAGPLPTTPVGKIRKNVLREPFWAAAGRRI